jgi:hypothetical protein
MAVRATIPRKWALTKSGPEDPPMIQFRFPAPLDNYAGEVTSGKGEFVLPESLRVDGAKGFIEVDTRNSITMGEPILDETIRGRFKIDLRVFKIEGTDGSAPARHTLLFDVNFILKANGAT